MKYKIIGYIDAFPKTQKIWLSEICKKFKIELEELAPIIRELCNEDKLIKQHYIFKCSDCGNIETFDVLNELNYKCNNCGKDICFQNISVYYQKVYN